MTVLPRRALAIFLPLALLLTIGCGLAYGEVQSVLRGDANDPQIELARDAATALDGGASPASVVPGGSIDLASSLAPFVAVYDPTGHVLATDGQLDGDAPALPAGVLASATANGEDRVTWQPRDGVRIALVVVPWRGGTVGAGRSLAEVEDRENNAELLAAAAWLVGLVLLAGSALVAARLWPEMHITG